MTPLVGSFSIELMLLVLTMPQFGESITEGHIVRWLKKEGESVTESEPLVEMETEKSVFSYESPFRGTLVKIIQGDEASVSVGSVIAHFEVSEDDEKKYLALGIGKSIGEKAQSDKKESGLSPMIRSLAKEHRIPINEVEGLKGTGLEGHLTKEDFLEFLKKREPPKSEIQISKTGIKTIPVLPIRSRIADNMVLSKQRIPHAGCGLDVDLSTIEGWRADKKGAPGLLSFILVSVVQALKKNPHMNSSWREAEGKRWIEQYEAIHLGIATATDQGLVVPVIKEAQTLSFKRISQEVQRLIEAARKGNLALSELTGATFTVNNAGALGTLRSHQIIPYPQAAIVAINRVVKRPWVVGDKIEIRPILSLDISFDHRLLDGAEAIKFLSDIATELEGFDFKKI